MSVICHYAFQSIHSFICAFTFSALARSVTYRRESNAIANSVWLRLNGRQQSIYPSLGSDSPVHVRVNWNVLGSRLRVEGLRERPTVSPSSLSLISNQLQCAAALGTYSANASCPCIQTNHRMEAHLVIARSYRTHT